MTITKKIVAAASVVGLLALAPVAAYAATTANSKLTQEITAGVLSTDIVNQTGGHVAAPSFAMASKAASTTQQTATGTFGTNEQRVMVDNPGGANGGWTLTWNATTPGTGKWTGAAGSYAYNGAPAAGQLTVDPSTAALRSTVGTDTGISKGARASFTGNGAITLLTGAANSDDVWSGYITGVSLSQTIPAGQAVGSYTLDMTQTVTAS